MIHTRAETRQFKAQGLGVYVDSGKVFLFKAQKRKALFDGPIGVGNVLPFARLYNYGDKLHYETPMAGDRGIFARHHRKFIRVSSRSFFSHQLLPAAVSA